MFTLCSKQTVAFNALLFILFCFRYFSCYNIVAKFYCLELYLSCLCLRVLWSQLQCFTYTWSRLCWLHVTSKIIVCYHLPTRGRAGVKLGDADTLQTYLLFLMLLACFTPILICFMCTLWHYYAFSGTNLLTRRRSASSCFLLLLYFRKVV